MPVTASAGRIHAFSRMLLRGIQFRPIFDGRTARVIESGVFLRVVLKIDRRFMITACGLVALLAGRVVVQQLRRVQARTRPRAMPFMLMAEYRVRELRIAFRRFGSLAVCCS